MKKAYHMIFFLISSVILFSCGKEEINTDPTNLPLLPQDRQKILISDVCKKEFKNLRKYPKVAVVNFTNNTTFDTAKLTQGLLTGRYNRNTVGAGVVGGGRRTAGFIYGEAEAGNINASLEKATRQINAKLGESVAEAVESVLAEIGGVEIFTRSQLKQVINEQKFQQSGLVDEKTTLEVGKLSGVKYIITGTVNNVEIRWLDLSDLKLLARKYLGSIGDLMAVGASFQEGWHILTDITIKMIDVETGKVIFTKEVSGKAYIGRTPYLTYDAIIGGIKSAAKEAVQKAKKDIAKYFSIKGYIIQLRTTPDKEERYAMINLGAKQGVKEGQVFYIYDLQEIEDPISGKVSCIKSRLPVNLVITNYVSENTSWGKLEGDKKYIMKVKLGQIVERALENQ